MTDPLPVPLLDLKPQYRALKQDIDAAIARVSESQYFILGPEVDCFEAGIATYCATDYAIGVSSGTDALLVAMMAADIGRGDEVICPAYTFFGTAGSIARLGARPVFVDIEPESFNLVPDRIESAVTDRTRAIMPVHLFGQMADMAAVNAVARKHNLLVIEDAAQAIGAGQSDRPAGSHGDMGCLSFFPTKNLGGFGDGGMLVTNDTALAETARQLRNHGMSPKYYHSRIGGNFRLDALQASILNVKLPHLEAWHAQRRRNAALYRDALETLGVLRDLPELMTEDPPPGVAAPRELPGNTHVYNQFVIHTTRRDALMAHLKERGIGCEIYYPVPLHLQECFRYLGHPRGAFPNAERAATMSLALPIYPELTSEQIGRVAEEIAAFHRS